jgi:hypothetical protein
MKQLAIGMAIGSLMACDGCSGGGSATAPTPPANVAADYTATITASATCSANAPAGAWVLTYAATDTQTGAAVEVKLIQHQGSTVTVTGTVSGQRINFPSLSFSQNTRGGVVAPGAAGKAGTLSGAYQAAAGTRCNAVDHQLELNRCEVACPDGACNCG